MLLTKVVTMSSFYNNNDKNADDVLTLKQPSISSSSDKNVSLPQFGTKTFNSHEPPMGQSLDLEEDKEEMKECEEPPMHQPSNLEVESNEGTVSSVSSLSSWYLPQGLHASLKAMQLMMKSQPEFEIAVLDPMNRPPKTLNDGSPDTAQTVLCDANSCPNFLSNESDDDTVVNYSLPCSRSEGLWITNLV